MRGGADRLVEAGLVAGIAVPIVYFGTQAAAMAFTPGYDLFTEAASRLGADGAPAAGLFNTGAIVTGLATLASAWGIGRGLVLAGAGRVLASLSALALVSSGLASLNAGFFHLPDPRHNPGWLGAGMFLFPILGALASWRIPGASRLRLLLLACLLGLAAVAPFMAGVTGLDRAAWGGFLQRLVALALLLPVAFTSAWLLRQIRSRPG